jgi:acetyl esterase/lipase
MLGIYLRVPEMKSALAGVLALIVLLCAMPALAQMPPPRGISATPTHRDISYAPAMPATSKGHLLDVYLPEGRSGQLPLVIWTSGSAFLGDTGKEGARFMAPELLAAGFAVAGVSVRSSGQVKFPGQVHDIKAAIRYLRANAVRFNINPDRIAIMGDSSGGWMTSMAALTGDVPALEGRIGTTGVSSAVQAAVAFYPPTDFLTMDKWAVARCTKGIARPGPGMCHEDKNSPESLLVNCAILTCADKTRAADPGRYVSDRDPPIMILHGRSDALVPHQQGEHLYKTLVQNCRNAVFYSLPLAGHGPAWDFMDKAAIKQGATIETSSSTGCKAELPKLSEPGWDAVIDFLKSSIRLAS